MEKIAMGFRRMGFVVNVRFFGETKISFKSLSDYLKTVYRRTY